MRICMIISTPFPPEEGIGFHVYNISRRLIERGHEVFVITRGSLKLETDTLEGIKIFRVPFIPLYPFHVHIHGFFLNRFFKSVESNFDLIHIHMPLTPILKTSLPIITTMHGSIIGNANSIKITDFKSLAIKILAKFVSYPLSCTLIKNSKAVISISNSVFNQLNDHYASSNIQIICNGVDERAFTPKKDKKSSGNYILYVGRLSYGKGIFDLLEASKQIIKYCNIKILLVGKGELELKIKKRIFENNLENNVILKGHLENNELIEIYKKAKIFAFPSHYEGLPTALLEAMACGLPIVTTSVSGCVDLIQDNYNGLLVPPKSPKKLSERIITLIKDDLLRERLGKNARKTVENNYTWDSIVDEIESVYKEVLN